VVVEGVHLDPDDAFAGCEWDREERRTDVGAAGLPVVGVEMHGPGAVGGAPVNVTVGLERALSELDTFYRDRVRPIFCVSGCRVEHDHQHQCGKHRKSCSLHEALFLEVFT